jgi:hypothetical protein
LDRLLLVLLARQVRAGRQPLVVQPETLLRRHQAGFGRFWRRKAKVALRTRRRAPEVVALIQQLARAHRLWGAVVSCGERRKFGVRVRKRTIQRSMRRVRMPWPCGQIRATFLRHHGQHS